MKNILFFILTLFFVSLGVVSCVSKKPQEPVIIEKTKEVFTTIKDTVFTVKADSSYYYAFVDCVNGKPVIRETPETKSQSKPGTILNQPKIKLNGNALEVECYKSAQELYHQWRETYIKEHEQTPIYVDQPVYKDKPLTWFQTTQIWLGRIFLGFLAVIVLVLILKWKRLI